MKQQPLPFKPALRNATQRLENLNTTFHAKPTPYTWLFVYGLLAKDPPFKYVKAEPFTLQGWHREFNLADPLNRGTSTSPGVTLGIMPGGECPGIAYLLAETETYDALVNVWEQEMLLPFYIPQWIEQNGRHVLIMTTDPASPALWQPLSHPHIREILHTSRGSQGSNHHYLTDVITAFTAFQQHDNYLESFA